MKKIIMFSIISSLSFVVFANNTPIKFEKVEPNKHLQAPDGQICKVKNNKLSDCKEVKTNENGRLVLVTPENKETKKE